MKTFTSMLAIAAVIATGMAAYGNERSVYQLQSRWTDDSGRHLTLSELSGRFQIVAFIFTHCGGACPLLVKSLQAQARNLPASARARTRFLLVSMDPERDDVEALHRYRKDMGLDEQWTLLRAADPEVRELAAVLGFNYQRSPDGQFAHSNQITLLDPSGEIVLQHPEVEGAVGAMSAAIADCILPVVGARPQIAGKNCN